MYRGTRGDIYGDKREARERTCSHDAFPALWVNTTFAIDVPASGLRHRALWSPGHGSKSPEAAAVDLGGWGSRRCAGLDVHRIGGGWCRYQNRTHFGHKIVSVGRSNLGRHNGRWLVDPHPPRFGGRGFQLQVPENATKQIRDTRYKNRKRPRRPSHSSLPFPKSLFRTKRISLSLLILRTRGIERDSRPAADFPTGSPTDPGHNIVVAVQADRLVAFTEAVGSSPSLARKRRCETISSSTSNGPHSSRSWHRIVPMARIQEGSEGR